MKVQRTNNQKSCTFKDVPVGHCFRWEGLYYLKLHDAKIDNTFCLVGDLAGRPPLRVAHFEPNDDNIFLVNSTLTLE